jgi:phosphomannomutase
MPIRTVSDRVLTVSSTDMRKLAEHSGIPFAKILFFGDAIYPGGNDEPVCKVGIDAIAVRDVAETRTAISTLLACMRSR